MVFRAEVSTNEFEEIRKAKADFETVSEMVDVKSDRVAAASYLRGVFTFDIIGAGGYNTPTP